LTAVNDYSYFVERRDIPWRPYRPDDPRPLNRHIRHDSRSKLFAEPEVDPSTFVKVDWADHIGILDQGSLGSCTGNATVGNLGTDPFYPTLPLTSLTLDETLAVAIYGDATKLDDYDGSYPPTDTGSDGLSVAKVAQNRGLISGYTHALSLNAALAGLQKGPVITGVNWYDGFDEPDSNGLVHKTGSVRGGHEFVVVGYDPSTNEVKARNSWGTGYGMGGYFYFSTADWQALLNEQGDVTIFTPLNQPAPTPTPVPTPTPTPDDADQALAKVARPWSQQFHWYSNNKHMAQALQTWLKAKGL
jgi:hypothetical protein